MDLRFGNRLICEVRIHEVHLGIDRVLELGHGSDIRPRWVNSFGRIFGYDEDAGRRYGVCVDGDEWRLRLQQRDVGLQRRRGLGLGFGLGLVLGLRLRLRRGRDRGGLRRRRPAVRERQ